MSQETVLYEHLEGRIAQLEAENARLTALDEHSRLAFRGQQEQLEGLVKENARLTAELAGKSAVVDRIESEFALACEKFATERDALATRCGELDVALRHLKGEAYTNLDCNHPGRAEDEGSDYCDGEDCIHCHIIQTVDAALAASEPSTQANDPASL